MGVIYIIANHTKKEYIDPLSLGMDGKEHGITKMGMYLIQLLLHKYKEPSWRNDYIEIVSSDTAEYDVSLEYKDISKEVEQVYGYIYRNICRLISEKNNKKKKKEER